MPTGFSLSSYGSQNPPLLDFPYSESRSDAGISQSQRDRSSADRIFSIGGSHLHAPRWDVPMHESVSADMPRAFLNCPIGFKTLCCGIFPARSLTLLLGFFPLRVIYPSLMAFPPLRGSRLYAPRRDVLPRGSVNADMPTGLSRSPTRVEPSIVRILPLRVT